MNNEIDPKITILLLMIIPLSLIGMEQDAHAQTVVANMTGDPLTLREGTITLFLYGFTTPPVISGNTINATSQTLGEHYVDPISQMLIFNTNGLDLQYLFIDLDYHIDDLQEIINPVNLNVDVSSSFQWDVSSMTTQNGTVDIYLVLSDDREVGIDSGTVVPLVENGDPQNNFEFDLTTKPQLYDSSLWRKNLGLLIGFNNPISLDAGSYPISADFSLLLFQSDGTPINHITRQPPELTPEQQITYQKLVNVINARNLAITQQELIRDYWSDAVSDIYNQVDLGPLSEIEEHRVGLGEARKDYARDHMRQTTEQRDSYQAQLIQLLNP